MIDKERREQQRMTDFIIGKYIEYKSDTKARFFEDYFDEYLTDQETAISSIYTMKYIGSYDLEGSNTSLTDMEYLQMMQDRIENFLLSTSLPEKELKYSKMTDSVAFALMEPEKFRQMKEKQSAIETLAEAYVLNPDIIGNASKLGRFKFTTLMIHNNKVANNEEISEEEQKLFDWINETSMKGVIDMEVDKKEKNSDLNPDIDFDLLDNGYKTQER